MSAADYLREKYRSQRVNAICLQIRLARYQDMQYRPGIYPLPRRSN